MGPMTEGHLARPTILHVEYTQILSQRIVIFVDIEMTFFVLVRTSNVIIVRIFAFVDATVAAPSTKAKY
jgi:hypothetical protein